MDKYEHGGDFFSKQIEYDFSVNINPLGMPANAVKALSLNISQYERSLEHAGCKIKFHNLKEENGFMLTETVLDQLKDIDLFFLCNPNNPVGNLVDAALLEKIVMKCRKEKIQMVVDECFIDFVDGSERYTSKKYIDTGIIVLKAFTKIFAMAGIRLGYILCMNQSLLHQINACGSFWNVSIPAQIAGTAALNKDVHSYLRDTRKVIREERQFLTESLRKYNFSVYDSSTNFILFQTKLHLDHLLLKSKIAIRNCENYHGLEYGYFRIAVRSHIENVRLISEIERNLLCQNQL